MYAFTQDVPIDAAFYRQITDRLGEEPPKGLIAHLAPSLARRLRVALRDALREIGEDPGQ